MPVKYMDENTFELLDNDAVNSSGAPRAYGIKTIADLVGDAHDFQIFSPK